MLSDVVYLYNLKTILFFYLYYKISHFNIWEDLNVCGTAGFINYLIQNVIYLQIRKFFSLNSFICDRQE